MNAVSRRLKRWLGYEPGDGPRTPAIRPHRMRRDRPELHLRGPKRRDDSHKLVSQLCRYRTLDSDAFRQWAAALDEPWRPHRKLWELAFICQALDERAMLRPGRRGLGFAVGAEKLPAFFASRGCGITATDLPADDERRTPWAETGQWVGALDALNQDGLCDVDAFRERATYRPVDMNEIPTDLRGFDFTWSTCSFEHCGSLDLGLEFLERQMDCLVPGGIAVHTTEFNLSSNDETVADGSCVIYRLRDMEAICSRLAAAGHHVEPLDIHPGNHALDAHVDQQPYWDWKTSPPAKVKHLRLNLWGHASTSIAIIIRKAS